MPDSLYPSLHLLPYCHFLLPSLRLHLPSCGLHLPRFCLLLNLLSFVHFLLLSFLFYPILIQINSFEQCRFLNAKWIIALVVWYDLVLLRLSAQLWASYYHRREMAISLLLLLRHRPSAHFMSACLGVHRRAGSVLTSHVYIWWAFLSKLVPYLWRRRIGHPALFWGILEYLAYN